MGVFDGNITESIFGWVDDRVQVRRAKADGDKVKRIGETLKVRRGTIDEHATSVREQIPDLGNCTEEVVITTIADVPETVSRLGGIDSGTVRNAILADAEASHIEATKQLARIERPATLAYARYHQIIKRPAGYFRKPGAYLKAKKLGIALLLGGILLDAIVITNFISGVLDHTPFGYMTVPVALLFAVLGIVPMFFAGRLAREAAAASQAARGGGALGAWIGAISLASFGIILQFGMFMLRTGLDTGDTNAKSAYAGFGLLTVLLAVVIMVVEFFVHTPSNTDDIVCAETDKTIIERADQLHQHVHTKTDRLRHAEIDHLQKQLNARKNNRLAVAGHDNKQLNAVQEQQISDLESRIEALRSQAAQDYRPLDFEALIDKYIEMPAERTSDSQIRLLDDGDGGVAA
jgi:hypothetical protein